MSHNWVVNRFRTIWAVTLVALLFSALTPRSYAAWQCEGRTCSTTPWACCCDLPVEGNDRNCQSSTRPVAESAPCTTDCGCVLIVRAAVTALRAASPTCSAASFQPALPAGGPASLMSLPCETVARATETGGPAPRRLPWNTPSLRAPPVA